MVDITHLTVNNTVPNAYTQDRGLLMHELSVPKRTYGDFATALRTAKDNGYVIKHTLGIGDVLPTSEVMMNRLAPLVPYLSYIDALYTSGFAQIDGSANALKLFNAAALSSSPEMIAGSSGGGVIIDLGGKPALDLSAGQGRGLSAPLNPDDFNVYADGRALLWIGKITTIPSAAGTGQLVRIISGGTVYASFGVVPGGTAYRVMANRRIGSGGGLQQVTADGGVVTTGAVLKAFVPMDIVTGTVAAEVNGASAIGSTSWGAGAGILDATSLTAQFAVPGASVTHNVQHMGFAIINTKNATINNAILTILAASFS